MANQHRKQTKPQSNDAKRRQSMVSKWRGEIDKELPDLIERDRMREEARQEQTLSGELRNAVHISDLSLARIAEQCGIAPQHLDEFLTGERTLRSDVLDRLARVLDIHAAKKT